MKKIIALALMSLFAHANAEDLKINGYSAKVTDPVVIQNIKDIASCSPKKYAQKEDFEEIVYYNIIKRPDLIANKLKTSCVVLNNKELQAKSKALKDTDQNFVTEIYTPLEFANSPESLLYMFTAKAPLEQSEGMKLSVYLSQFPTYFSPEVEKEEYKFRQEGFNVLKQRLGAKVANIPVNLEQLYKPSQLNEDNYDKMLAILIPWDLNALKNKSEHNGDKIVHKLAYMGRYQALNSVLVSDKFSIHLNEVNDLGETPIMLSFRPYCAVKEGWQKDRQFRTQQLLVRNIMYSDIYRKNINGNILSDYIKTYLAKENNPQLTNEINKLVETKSSTLLKDPTFNPVNVKYKDEYCN